jgi:flagellar FliJ protein
MKRSERLTTVLELAESREQQAARRLGEHSRKLENAQRNLENLRAFRENYAARFRQSGDRGLGMRQLMEFRVFLAKIDTAVADQERTVSKAQRELESRRNEWEATRRQALGMRTVMDRARAEESRAEEKRLQDEQDERACRRSGRSDNPLTAFI